MQLATPLVSLCGPLLFLSLVSQTVIAQNDDFYKRKIIRKAIVLVQNERYEAALPKFQELYKSKPTDPEYNYYLGLIYLRTATDKSTAIPHLQVAYEHKGDWPRASWYLARAHHLIYQFDKAIGFYEEYLTRLKSSADRSRIEHEIQKCRDGKLLVRDTVVSEITNLGKLINSTHPDYAPIISSDDRVLIFTSRRPTTTGGKRDLDNLFFEDIYMSIKRNGEWGAAKGVGEDVNTELHDASVALSADGQQMFMYHRENIYITTLKGDTWADPKKVGSNINTKSWETHACISLDQQVLYFTSDREGGYGGMDIYMALKLPNGNWGLVQNLGPMINTPYDEKAPFIHPADKTLYFSSEGHSNMGGFDIFRSSLINNKWTSPLNIGHPINTPGDDIFYVVSANGKHTYFSSDLRKDNNGGQDIYQLAMRDTGMVKIAVIKGRIYGEDHTPLTASFTVLDKQTKKVVGVYNSNPSTGRYLLVFPTDKHYDMVIRAVGFTPHRESFAIPRQEYSYNMFQEVGITLLTKDDSTIGQKIIFRNGFFDIETAVSVDPFLSDDGLEESNFSQFLQNLEDQNKREEVLASVLVLDESLYKSIYNYHPLNQVHLFHPADVSELEATIVEFDKDTVVLNNDTIFKKETIYATSSTSITKVPIAELDSSINIVLEEFERAERPSGLHVPIPDGPVQASSAMESEVALTTESQVKYELVTNVSRIISFEFDLASIEGTSSNTLDLLVVHMNANKELQAFVSGHTDHIGASAYNDALSLSRANVVADYIKSKSIMADRLIINGYGESRPIASNEYPDGTDNPDGRKRNRRTEIRLEVVEPGIASFTN